MLARAPVPGHCKTRLIPALGPAGAARLHHALVLRMAGAAVAAGLSLSMFAAPDPRHALFQECRRRFGARLRRQAGGDLGRRMSAAVDTLLRDGATRVVLTGTDSPALSAADLRAATHALARADAVLQPSFDGGYVLIGVRRPLGGTLRGIAWSSGRELDQTRRALRRAGCRVAVLGTRADLDTPADLRQARRAGLL